MSVVYAMQIRDEGADKWNIWFRSESLSEVQRFNSKNMWEYLSMGMDVRIARMVSNTGPIHSILEYHSGKK